MYDYCDMLASHNPLSWATDVILVRYAGFEDRKQLYMLYHYLNHTSLFGGMYKGSAESILRQLSSKYG